MVTLGTDKRTFGRNEQKLMGEWFDELLTPPTVASMLGVSAPTIYAALQRRNRRFEHIRTPGNQIRIRRRDVLAYCHREGIEVPMGLIPSRSPVVVLHPDSVMTSRIRSMLEPAFRVYTFVNDVEALVAVGSLRPPLALVSERYGKLLLRRLCTAIRDMSEIGYVTILQLTARPVEIWSGGPVPSPLLQSEPRDNRHRDLTMLIERLLGME